MSSRPPSAREVEGGVELSVRAKPRARTSRVLGEKDGLLEVALAAPPVDGAANEALLDVLARWLAVPRRQVTLLQGAGARWKRIRVLGATLEQVRSRLLDGQ